MRSLALAFVLGLSLSCRPPPPPLPETPAVPSGTQPDQPADPEPETPRLPQVWGPGALEDENPDPAVVEVSLTARAETVTLPGGRTLSMYTYNGQFPGPLLQARVGDRIIVHFQNDLPEPTTIHWHGLRISDQMDGNPRIQNPIEPGGRFTYDFVAKEAGSFWYHPHVRANEQVEKGLYGPIVIHGDADPAYDLERYVMLDDILLSGGGFPPFLETGHEMMHGRLGNVLLANGAPHDEPLSAVVPTGRIERWRLVNTANARTLHLTLENARFRVIGSDGGLLESAYTTHRLSITVGQRFDVEVVYDSPGTARLLSHVPTTSGEAAIPVFVVDVGTNDAVPREITWTVPPRPARTPGRTITLEFDVVNEGHGPMWRINGQAHPTEPILTATEGETVKLVLVNKAGPEHPFHLHGQFFEIVDQGNWWTHQPGLKDTVYVPGLKTVEIIAYLDNPGRWMAHCHILEHAEVGFMGEVVVEPRP